MMKKENKKSLVTLLIFGATIFLGAYLVNIKLLANEDMQRPEMAKKADDVVTQQLPWWKQWQRMRLTPFRGCKMGRGGNKVKMSLEHKRIRNNTGFDSVLAAGGGC